MYSFQRGNKKLKKRKKRKKVQKQTKKIFIRWNQKPFRAYKKTASVTTNNDSKIRHNDIDLAVKGTIQIRRLKIK